MTNVPQVLATVLFSSGCLCLSGLLLTVNAFETVPRHPVLVNFLRTWLLWSCFMLYTTVVSLTTPTWGNDKSLVTFQAGLRDVLWMATQVATLNLVIHTWIKMKIWHAGGDSNCDRTRTIVLVATPYFAGLAAIIEIFPVETPPLSNTTLINLPVDFAMGCLFLVVTSITCVWDVVLLFTFWRDRRILQQANIGGVMSISMLFRVLALCVYQIVMTVVCGIILTMPNKVPEALIVVSESLYPLLVFFLVGLKWDILHVWFPCWGPRLEETTEPSQELDFNTSASVVSISDGSQRSQRLEEKVG